MIRVTFLVTTDGMGWSRVPGLINPNYIISAQDMTWDRPSVAKQHATSGCLTEVCLNDGRKILCDASHELFAAQAPRLEERE